MSGRLIPVVLGGVLIIATTFVEGIYLKDRWGKPDIEAELIGQRFAQVPKEIGEWKGIDLPVDDVVKKTAGAVHYVSRRYKNSSTGQAVELWLIVGHSRDIIRHTPNICYPNSGFRPKGSQLRHTVYYGNGKEGRFYTSKFEKEDSFVRQVQRVFWAWNHPKKNKWDAPENPRFHYGMSNRSLYKVYFTSAVMSDENTIDDNPGADFAKLMLPAIDAALFPSESSPGTVAETTDAGEAL